jgi:acyl carrier protein
MTTLLTLKKLIHKTFDIDPATLDPQAPLADYGLDSLSLAELLFVVEDEFHIDFSEMPKDVNTLADLALLIDELPIKQAA